MRLEVWKGRLLVLRRGRRKGEGGIVKRTRCDLGETPDSIQQTPLLISH